MYKIGIARKDVFHVDETNTKKRFGVQSIAFGFVRQGLVNGGPMF